LAARLRHDYATVGSGASDFREFGPVGRDLGDEPPWGFLVMPCLTALHYREGEF
jgi:hypothetical protein